MRGRGKRFGSAFKEAKGFYSRAQALAITELECTTEGCSGAGGSNVLKKQIA